MMPDRFECPECGHKWTLPKDQCGCGGVFPSEPWRGRIRRHDEEIVTAAEFLADTRSLRECHIGDFTSGQIAAYRNAARYLISRARGARGRARCAHRDSVLRGRLEAVR